MENFSEKTFLVSRGLQYRYFASSGERQKDASPALLLLHGFRDFATCWKFLLPHLERLPSRILIPDLLGHGGSSKPTDPKLYAYRLMVRDLIEIMDAEAIYDVIPLGHDHGSLLAQRIYNHHPERTKALITLNVAYSPPSETPFNLAGINKMTKQIFGYGIFEYFHFLTSPDAARLMNANLDRVWEIPHANSFADMRSLYGDSNAMREYLQDSSIPSVALKPYATDPALKAEWKVELERGGLEGPLCWYTALVQQVQHQSDKTVPFENVIVRVPTLFIGCDGDAACRPEMISPVIDGGFLPDLTMQTLEGVGHWPMYEAPERTAGIVVEFLLKTLGLSEV